MYEYGICPQADRNIFDKQCLALEKNINGLQKGSLEEVDVDSHLIQHYYLQGKDVEVHLSKYLNEVYIKSDMELTQFFK
ncbi:hypothetical protein [Peptostreptococcus anaerobius]|uniref:hypothetical protein n=1 Tax=Peptostreptococcus anaerobius TaxID=1261 RepID=UPI0032195B72